MKNRTKTTTLLTLVAGLATVSFALKAGAQDDPNTTQKTTKKTTETTKKTTEMTTTFDRSDKEFVKRAYEDGQHTLALSQVVQERATNPKVKELAQHIVTDYTKINQELTDIGGKAAI